MSADGKRGLNGFVRYFDDCTAVPFLFNANTRQYISYDDAKSVNLKAQLVKAKGLAGVVSKFFLVPKLSLSSFLAELLLWDDGR